MNPASQRWTRWFEGKHHLLHLGPEFLILKQTHEKWKIRKILAWEPEGRLRSPQRPQGESDFSLKNESDHQSVDDEGLDQCEADDHRGEDLV